jgi:hypothetical protein
LTAFSQNRHAELVSASIALRRRVAPSVRWMLKQVQHDETLKAKSNRA